MAQRQTIQQVIAQIDTLLNAQMNRLLHHPTFQALEASWRGVRYLCGFTSQGKKKVKIRLLAVSASDAFKDLNHAAEFDQSQLFKKIYSSAFDQAGGEPFGLLVCDVYVSHQPTKVIRDSIGFVRDLAQIAAASFAPVLMGAAPELAGLNAFYDYPVPFNIRRLIATHEYDRWRGLQQDPHTRFVGLVAPRVLARVPYNRFGVSVRNRWFQEDIQQVSDYAWGNAAYQYAGLVLACYLRTGWFAEILGFGEEEASALVSIQREPLSLLQADGLQRKAVEYDFLESQERELSALGVTVLHDNPWQQQFYINNCFTLWQPKKTVNVSMNQHAEVSNTLNHLLCGARFAHYLKVIMRDKVGSFQSSAECQRFLEKWIRHYTSTADLSPTARAQYPLKSASVNVSEKPGEPGKYHCVIQVLPHYQLSYIYSELKLVTTLEGI